MSLIRTATRPLSWLGSYRWLVLGYTGIAYLDLKPTDQLIAEAISGYDEFEPAMFTFWQRPPYLHYREIRDRVESKLTQAYSRLSATKKSRATVVLGAGVQRKDDMVSKVMYRTIVRGDSATSIERPPTSTGFSPFRIDAVGMVKSEIIDRARDRIAAITGPVHAICGTVRDILKDAVLETSQLTPKVGDNVMTVSVDNPAKAIRTALHSPTRATGRIVGARQAEGRRSWSAVRRN